MFASIYGQCLARRFDDDGGGDVYSDVDEMEMPAVSVVITIGEGYPFLFVQGEEDDDGGPREDTAVEFLPAGEYLSV